ncbi:hypothetical protein [Arthrobacter sp. ISL-69]|uniref:hypothetical protein n=1 Tax=Arthrobacter sp. ISL-69 TaxID=2819113 RepID=UPI001BE62A79|nr:hypothetical protein [Arthrobacter sp. ISL-69]MBT2535072.1 hypothetical protein [Arthrobacter sp. ISL-69]
MPEGNDNLNSRVLEAATTGTELRLADATDFAWDEAGFVTEGTRAKDIEAAFGEAVTRENRYTASPVLFIFLKDGKVAKAARIIPDAFFGEDAKKKYGRDVVLTPLEGHKGIPQLARIMLARDHSVAGPGRSTAARGTPCSRFPHRQPRPRPRQQ